MPSFHYVARRTDGKLIDGSATCATRTMAIAQVESLGATPISLRADAGAEPAAKAAPAASSALAQGPQEVTRLSFAHQQLFTEQLAHLIGAGLTLDESLGILAQRLQQPRLRSLCLSLHRSLVDGSSFSQALRGFPMIFSSLYVNLVSAGEASGALSKILMRLTEHLSTLRSLSDKVKQALLYPAVLVVAGIGLIVTFMTVMVPKLTTFFKGTGQALPPATQMLIDLNENMIRYWWVAPIAVALAFGAYKEFTQTEDGRMAWDAMLWRFPVFSRITRFRFYVQFSQTLGTLCENGLTMLRALELLEEISGNTYVRARTQSARKAVVDGASLSAALRIEKLFPDLFLDMLAVGEQTGRLGETMHHIADVYDRELNKQVQVVTTLIPPMVMVGIAGMVGFVVYGIMSAVFGLTQNLRVQMH